MVHTYLLFFTLSKSVFNVNCAAKKGGCYSHHHVLQRISHPSQEGECPVCQDLLVTEETFPAAWKGLVLHSVRLSVFCEATQLMIKEIDGLSVHVKRQTNKKHNHHGKRDWSTNQKNPSTHSKNEATWCLTPVSKKQC